MLARLDRLVLDAPRPEDHAFWSTTPAVHGYSLRVGDSVAGYVYLQADGAIGPIAVADPARLPAAMEQYVAVLPDPFDRYRIARLTLLCRTSQAVRASANAAWKKSARRCFGAPIAAGNDREPRTRDERGVGGGSPRGGRRGPAAPVKYVDETGWKQAGRKRWLWAAATTTVAVFIIDVFRNVTALRKLLGPTLSGILCSDRWSAYDHVELLQRQVCWAHLKRNWEKMLERGGKAKSIAESCLSVQKRVFELWHLFRGGGCSRSDLDDGMAPLMLELLEILHAGLRCRERKTKRFCDRLLTVYAALWTFVVVEGVEPTNNHVERAQRRAVLWRRRSFGCLLIAV